VLYTIYDNGIVSTVKVSIIKVRSGPGAAQLAILMQEEFVWSAAARKKLGVVPQSDVQTQIESRIDACIVHIDGTSPGNRADSFPVRIKEIKQRQMGSLMGCACVA